MLEYRKFLNRSLTKYLKTEFEMNGVVNKWMKHRCPCEVDAAVQGRT